MRRASRDLLSLALLDARNATLRWLAVFESAEPAEADIAPSPFWLAGQAAWLQERWIARNVQWRRGPRCDPTQPPLASVAAEADAWWESPAHRPPSPGTLRAYLAETLDTTLDLLAGAEDGDEALHFFRLALWHEDRLPERFAAIAQAAALPPALQRPLWPDEFPSLPSRPELHMPARRWTLGSGRGDGFVPEAEKWAHEVEVEAFDIDPQPVSWSQFAEFVDDGGYDDERLWSEDGWAWVQGEGRRAPRHVERLRQGVLLQRAGELCRADVRQPAMHVAVHEAEAWCRWAGRRLPTEAEWELLAMEGRGLGATWGSVNEWVLGRARPYPDHTAGPVSRRALQLAWPGDEGAPLRVLRGASVMTAPRRRHPKARRFVAGEDDSLFSGFRSCA